MKIEDGRNRQSEVKRKRKTSGQAEGLEEASKKMGRAFFLALILTEAGLFLEPR